MNRIQRRLRAVAGLPFLCPPYVRNQGGHESRRADDFA